MDLRLKKAGIGVLPLTVRRPPWWWTVVPAHTTEILSSGRSEGGLAHVPVRPW